MTDLVKEIRAEIAGQQADDVLPFAYEDWEARAKAKLDSAPFGYIAGGAGGNATMQANRAAFDRYEIWPRMLRDVGKRDLTVKLFGTTSLAPFMLAPVAAQGIMHPDGERATARAAKSLGIPMVLSTMASTSLEEVADILRPVGCWFQLYAGSNRPFAKSLIKRAEAAAYSAIVATVDLPLLGWREAEMAHAYLPFLRNEGIANHLSDPAFMAALSFITPMRESSPSPERGGDRGEAASPSPEQPAPSAARGEGDGGEAQAIEYLENPRFTWKDLAWVRKQTRLPLLLKGILHPDDAKLAIKHGADGIIVSNHGGRQVDGSVAALDALPQVVKAVKGRVPVLMDSGIRRGADVLKALALGASAVLLGRPYAYGLAVAGEAGVRQVIRNLIAEFELQMALSGCRRVKDVDRGLLAPK